MLSHSSDCPKYVTVSDNKPNAQRSPAAGPARLLPPTSAYAGAEPLKNRAVGSPVERFVRRR
jgi:hypothetical protein